MSEPRYRDWILDTIDSLRSRRARPDLERICRMVRRRHGSEPEQTRCELEKLIQERTVLKVCYKGSISYRNAAKAQRRSRKKAQEDGEEEEEEARPEARSSQGGAGAGSSSSTHSSTDQGETGESEEEEKESVCTEEHIPEEEDVRKMEVEPSCSSAHTVEQCASNLQHKSGPADELADNTSTCQSHQASAPKPHTLEGSDAAAHPAACCTSADAQPALKHDTGDLDPGVQPRAVCPTVQKDPMTAEEEMRVEESAVTPDQLVTESSNTQDQVVMRSERGGQTSLGPSEDYLECKAEIGVSSCSPPPSAPCQQKGRATDAGSQSVACCESRRDTVHWSVSDVVSYFSTAGFPEQAAAFRSQEIDGKALLLMQRSDVLTGLSIRLGPALKIYEKHVKVLQKSHFEDDGALC